MCSDSDNEYDENLFDDGFFKSLLSFMNDDSDGSSCSSGYASEIFSLDNVVTSGFLGSTQHYGDLIYRKCNFSNRLYTSWSASSGGLKASSQESTKMSAYEDYDEHMKLKTIEEKTESDVFNQDLMSDFQPTLNEKNLIFIKLLRNSLLPEFQNHPARLKQIRTKSVRSDPQVMPKLALLPATQSPLLPSQTFDENKENVSQSAQKLKICKFCFKNGEPSVVYMGHFLKTSNGIITCPILRRYTCDICGATGPKSHTRKYCPKNTEPAEVVPPFRRLTNGTLTRSLNHK